MKIKEFQENMKKFGKVLKKIETINGAAKIDNGKDFIKIRFESNDDLPMSKPLRLNFSTIAVRYLFSEGGKFYPKLFLDGALYELA